MFLVPGVPGRSGTVNLGSLGVAETDALEAARAAFKEGEATVAGIAEGSEKVPRNGNAGFDNPCFLS